MVTPNDCAVSLLVCNPDSIGSQDEGNVSNYAMNPLMHAIKVFPVAVGKYLQKTGDGPTVQHDPGMPFNGWSLTKQHLCSSV
jgi:hypothetical protein